MAHRQPPAPKERPFVLSTSAAPSTTPPFVSSTKGPRKSDDIGAIVFIILIVLGLLASARAFLLLGP